MKFQCGQYNQTKSNKIRKKNYTINKHTIQRFKVVADKDIRIMSNIVRLLNYLKFEEYLNIT